MILRSLLAAIASLGVTAPSAAQTTAPSAAPAEWVRYAEAATIRISEWLQAKDETALRLHAYLDQSRPEESHPHQAIVIKVWIDKRGAVSAVDFTPFAEAQPNSDLRALIVGKRLDGPPPRKMRQPIRLAIDLEETAAAPLAPN